MRPNARANASRILATLVVLGLFAFGRAIPLPGLDPAFLQQSRVQIEHVSIFALGVTPILSVLILQELAYLAAPRLFGGRRREAAGRARLTRPVLVFAFALAAFQGFGVARGLAGWPGVTDDPGFVFILEVVATLIGATACLAWLARVNSRQGFGDGCWLLLAGMALVALPHTLATMLEMQRRGVIGADALLASCAFIAVSAAAIVIAREMEARAVMRPGALRALSLRVNYGFVWPPLLATMIGGLAVSGFMMARGLGAPALSASGYLAVRMLVVAALIALITALRATPLSDYPWRSGGRVATPAMWLMALAEIAICAASDELTTHYGAAIFPGGPVLIVTIAVAMDACAQWRLA